MSLKLITAPAAEPVLLAEAKLHCRVDGTDDDALLTALIVAAREAAEHELGRALITQTWEKVLDAFPSAIRLPYPPCQAIVSVKYLDGDGIEQTLAAPSYQLDSHSEPAWLVPAYGYGWPATRAEPNAVRVQFRAGYGDAGSDVPEAICLWILLQVGNWFRNREAASDLALIKTPYVDRLLDRYRLYSLA